MNKKITVLVMLLFLLSCKKVDKEKPFVSIIFPPDGYNFLPDTLVVKVRANDNKGIEFVELFLNDTIKVNTKYSADSQDIWFFYVDFTQSPDSTYYTLKARAVDKSGNFSFSQKVNVLITFGNHPPSIPSLLFPPNGYIFEANVCTLLFKSVDPDGDTVIYDIFLSADSIPSLYLTNYNDTIFIDTLDYNKIYFWKIKARDKNGLESESEVKKFKTSSPNNPPEVPANPSPPAGDTLVPLLPTFSWTCSDPDGDSLKYDFYLDTKDNFQNPLISFFDLSEPYFTPLSSLLPGVLYFWKVKAKDGRGGETFSPIWSFRTKKLTLSEIYSNGVFSRDVEIVGNYLYEVGGEAKYYSLKIYDISTPGSPYLLKEVPLDEIPWNCEVNENFCVIISGTYGNRVKIYKRVFPDSLEFLRSFELDGWIGEAKISGNSLFLIDKKCLLRIELTQNPYIYDSVLTLSPPIDLDLWSGGNIYILSGESPNFKLETYDFSLSYKSSLSLNIWDAKNISFIDSGIVITTYNFLSDSLFLISLSQMLPTTIVDRMALSEGIQVSEYFSPFLFLASDQSLQMFTHLKGKIYSASFPYSVPNIYGIQSLENYIYIASFSSHGLCAVEWTE